MNKKVFVGNHPLPFSNVVVHGGTAYVAGQVGFEKDDKLSDNIKDQTRATLENLKRSLQQAGFNLNNVVKVGAYLVNQDDFVQFNEVYGEYFQIDKPVRTTIFCGLARDEFLVEIDAIAVK